MNTVHVLRFLAQPNPADTARAVALVRQIVSSAKALAQLTAPGVIDPMLAADNDGFTPEELEEEGALLKSIYEQPSVPGQELVTLPAIPPGGLLNDLQFIERTHVAESLLGFLMSQSEDWDGDFAWEPTEQAESGKGDAGDSI